MAPVRGLLVDRMSKSTIACLAVTYFVALVVLVIGAALSPERYDRRALDVAPIIVANERANVDYAGVTLAGLAPTNQFLLLRGRLMRPKQLGGEQRPALLSQAVEYDQVYTFSVSHTDYNTGAVTVLQNLTHAAHVRCAARAVECDMGVLAFLPSVTFDTLVLDLNLVKPLQPWVDAYSTPNVQLLPQINAYFTATMVADRYSRFEMGWRYTGVVISLLVFLVYTILLACGPGVTDAETGKRVAATFEQKFILALSLLVIFLDRPGFASEIVQPTLGAYAFGAVTQTTALAALLFYWLFHFHIIALQSEAGASGMQWDDAAYGAGDAAAGRRPHPSPVGPCFFIPKVLIIALGWAVFLSTLLYSRFMQLTDPAFSVMESYPEFAGYLRGFAFAIGGIYLLMLIFYIALGLRKCRSMPRSGVLFTAVTLLTIVLVLAGLFTNSFTSTISGSGYFVLSYGIANVYIWMLCVFFSPAKRVTLGQLASNAAALAAGKDLPSSESETESGGDGSSSATTTSGGVLAGAGGVTAEEVALEEGSAGGEREWEAAATGRQAAPVGGRRAASAVSGQPPSRPTEAPAAAAFGVEASTSGPEAPGFSIEDGPNHQQQPAAGNPF